MTIPAAAIRFAQGFRLGQVQEHHSDMNTETLLLGVDGGGTLCRARLQAMSGELLGESMAGPANIRLDLQQSFSAVLEATTR